jgi:O-methyltransferase domain/Dimerisation domain
MATSAQTQAHPAHAEMFQLLQGAFTVGAIACLAQLGVPDLLEGEPKTADKLAEEVGADPRALYRLMRATASLGVLSEGPDGKFSQTPLSSVLRTKASPSLRAFATMHGREWHEMGWSNLAYCVKSGKQALEKTYGMPIFEYFTQNKEEGELFNRAMSDLSSIDAPAIAAGYSFEHIQSIVDVGGGHGLLLATILQRNPHMRGILYDLEHVIEGAKTGPLQPVLDRCTLASGDMFASVPHGVDAYIMKHILHDWPDDICVKILKACRKGVNAGGKLLAVDNVIQPGNDFAPGKFLDLQMLIFPGGRERTEKEFRELFAEAGWRLTRVIPLPVPESIVEGVPA